MSCKTAVAAKLRHLADRLDSARVINEPDHIENTSALSPPPDEATMESPPSLKNDSLTAPGDRKVLDDELLNWLRFVNAGMLDAGNIVAMNFALARLPQTGAMIEIGSFCGLSTNVMAHLRRRFGIRLPFFAADPWKFEGADNSQAPLGDGGLTFGEYRKLVRDSFIRNTRAFSRLDLPQAIELSSDEFFQAWDKRQLVEDVYGRPSSLGGTIAFCYIDGDHTYDQARRDFENVDRHIEPGGFILFDDSADGSGWEVCRLVQEITHNERYRLVGKYGNYLFQAKENPAANW